MKGVEPPITSRLKFPAWPNDTVFRPKALAARVSSRSVFTDPFSTGISRALRSVWSRNGAARRLPDVELITLEGVSKTYDDGASYAVRYVKLTVEEGSLLILLGESRCGKTTTLKMISRLVELFVTRITVAEKDIQGHVRDQVV